MRPASATSCRRAVSLLLLAVLLPCANALLLRPGSPSAQRSYQDFAAHAVRPPVGRMAPPTMFNLDYLKGTWERLTDLRVARASHILLKGVDDATLQQMLVWKEEIGDDAVKFAEYATRCSVCPSKRNGGDLGFFTRGKMVKEFDAIVFGDNGEIPGAVYGPVRSDFGHHLIYIHSCRTP